MTPGSKLARLSLATLVVAAGLASRLASADAIFYLEESADGKIYVFHDAALHDRWKAGGTLQNAVARPGEGPKGEELVFDGPEAIVLYRLQHDASGKTSPVQPDAGQDKKKPWSLTWKDGVTAFESESALVTLTNTVQLRYAYGDPEQDAETGSQNGAFSVRRAKTKLAGWLRNRRLTFAFQVDWLQSPNPIADAQVGYDFTGTGAFQIQVGQFKVPFVREELTSHRFLQFPDRSNVAEEFSRGRDRGVMLWGFTPGHHFDWRMGVFNGAGIETAKLAAPGSAHKYLYNAQLTFQPWGEITYSDGDFENLAHPRLAVVVAYAKNFLKDEVLTDGLAGELAFKFRGLSVLGEYYHRRNLPTDAPHSISRGWNVQAGYFVVPKTFEVALRDGQIDPSDRIQNDKRTEEAAVLNWYFSNSHALKLQGEVRRLEDREADTRSWEGRLQLQVLF